MLKVDDELDQLLVAKVYEAEQEHVFDYWEELTEPQRRELLDQLGQVDFQLLSKLIKLIDQDPESLPDATPIQALRPDPAEAERLAGVGWEALSQGKVACLVVAGGQGTRLDWAGPKGTYPVGPVSHKSLFQVFAEQIRAISKRSGSPLAWYVLTSRMNRDATESFFRESAYFGLDPNQVRFLVQKDLPNVDPRGKLLLASKYHLAMSPNGHGGTLQALIDGKALEQLGEEGVEHLFYFQVDNPLCHVCDPAFVGAHVEAAADMSTEVVRKVDPAEKIGVIAERGGKASVVEYSELSEEQAGERDEAGELRFALGNIAIHMFRVGFLQGLADSDVELSYHVARKKVTCLNTEGQAVKPEEPNAVKFETFIFGLLDHAEAHVALEVERDERFEPLKNKRGDNSPETVAAAQSARARRWIRDAGGEVPEDVVVEISPDTALDPQQLRSSLPDLDLDPSDGKLAL